MIQYLNLKLPVFPFLSCDQLLYQDRLESLLLYNSVVMVVLSVLSGVGRKWADRVTCQQEIKIPAVTPTKTSLLTLDVLAMDMTGYRYLAQLVLISVSSNVP